MLVFCVHYTPANNNASWPWVVTWFVRIHSYKFVQGGGGQWRLSFV